MREDRRMFERWRECPGSLVGGHMASHIEPSYLNGCPPCAIMSGVLVRGGDLLSADGEEVGVGLAYLIRAQSESS